MRIRRVLAALLAVGAALTLLGVPAAAEEEKGAANAKAWVLVEQSTGTLLGGENIHDQLEPASVTKVMTMLLVVEALDEGILSTDDVVTTSEYASSMGGSQIYLKVGEQITVDDLLKSLAVVSANDSAVALAEYLCGSESAFVDRMNQRAEELGMTDTHFVNCNGLPAQGHVTSAWDIALMSRALMTHERIKEYTTIWMDSVRNGEFQLANTNKLVRTYTGITGLKTGYTDGAGYCLSATAERDGMGLVAVVLGAPSSAERFSMASTLLDYGFSNYTVVDVNQSIPEVEVRLGETDEVQPRIAGDTQLVVTKSQASQVTTSVELEEFVEAPVDNGQQVGELVVSIDGAEWERIPLEAGYRVERLTFRKMFGRLWREMAMAE